MGLLQGPQSPGLLALATCTLALGSHCQALCTDSKKVVANPPAICLWPAVRLVTALHPESRARPLNEADSPALAPERGFIPRAGVGCPRGA